MPETKSFTVAVSGIHCASCANVIKETAQKIIGINSCEVNLSTNTLTTNISTARFKAADFANSLTAKGYKLELSRTLFYIKDFECPSCVEQIESQFLSLCGVVQVEANFAASTIYVEYIDELISDLDIRKKITDLGHSIEAGAQIIQERSSLLLTKIVVSLIAASICMLISHIESISSNRVALYFELVLATIVQFWAGWQFHSGFLRSLRNLTANMNTLISLGTSAAYFYSFYMLFHGESSMLWFDTSTMIIAIILVGRLIEQKARKRTANAITRLLELPPKKATTITNDKEEVKDIERLSMGDLVLIRPGERIPCDGTVEEGSSTIDASVLTGESMPQEKSQGSQVHAGTINLSGILKVKVEKDPRNTVVSQILRIVRQAQASKAKVEALADRVCSIFAPAVLVISIVTLIYWLNQESFRDALRFSVSVLIIACPCALGLATPAAVAVAVGRGSELGILFKDAQSLENLCRVKMIIFDKTGTLTTGRLALSNIYAKDTEYILKIAASLEHGSNHPIAKAIRNHYNGQLLEPQGLTQSSGLGVSGRLNSHEYLIGSRNFMNYKGIDLKELKEFEKDANEKGQTTIFIAEDNKLLGAIALSDQPREQAKEVLSELKKSGTALVMLSGDSHRTARSVADHLEIDSVLSEVMPQDKAKEVMNLKSEGHKIAFVGDGINDAPALAASDVGIAIGSGQDIAIESSDIVLVETDLQKILTALRLSKKTLRIISQNLAWAFGYNILLIPLAAGVFYRSFGLEIHPALASIFMSLSSITVVLNSLRLRKA